MNRSLTGCVALVTLGLIAGCSADPVSQDRQRESVVSAASRENLADKGPGENGRGPKRFIAVRDDCDPSDPTWAATGGCSLKHGVVSNAEFGALLNSPLSLSVVGHPAWRNEPSFISITNGQSVEVSNEGGRTHTFTLVANFGGGRVPPLRMGLTPAPECATATDLLPGASVELTGLGVGTHRYMCCIHSWMRAAIEVLPNEKGG